MSVFRYKGSKVWTMDFLFHGQRIRESTGTRSKTLALKIEDKRRRALEEGAAGIRKQRQPLLLSVAADEWLDMKKATLAPRSVKIEQANLAHLLPELGRKLICDLKRGTLPAISKRGSMKRLRQRLSIWKSGHCGRF